MVDETLCNRCRLNIRTKLSALRKGPAYGKVYWAIQKGILPKIDRTVKCVDCGDGAQVYDHRDYNEPLKVEPVCCRCNLKIGMAIHWKPNEQEILDLEKILNG